MNEQLRSGYRREKTDANAAPCRGAQLGALLLLICLSGCGSQFASSVSGVVTLDGKPVPKGTIAFVPEKGAIAYGQTGSNGSYRLRTGSREGLAPGEYTVTVAAIEGKPLPPTKRNRRPTVTNLVPKKYASPASSGLRYAVTPGKNAIDIRLTSDGP